MGHLEPRLIETNEKTILIWKRFIDDIFIIWNDSHEALTNFIQKINGIHTTIKLTYESSDQELTFLDTTVYKGPNFQQTGIPDIKTHIKTTNKQLYIHQTSYHPNSCKTAIATGETIRYLTTNTQEHTFKPMTSKLTNKLIERGYKARNINETITTPIHQTTTSNQQYQRQRYPNTPTIPYEIQRLH